MTGVEDGTAVAVAGKKVTVSWEDNSGQGNAQSTDKTKVLLICPELNETFMEEGTKVRMDLTFDITTQDDWVGKEVHCYMCFITPNRKSNSDSSYLGSVTILA